MPGDPSSGYWLGAAVFGLAAVGSLYGFFARLRRDRVLSDTPIVRIRSAAQGYIHVEGHAAQPADSQIIAPLSHLPCVWWDYKIEKHEENSKGQGVWRSIDRASSVTPFILADSSGQCLVGPINAEITPTSRNVWTGTEARPSGLSPINQLWLNSERKYRYTERLIAVGTRLSVLGELRSHSELLRADQAAYALLRDWKRDQAGLTQRFDSNNDGRIDSSEWDNARAEAQVESQKSQLQSTVERISVVAESTHGEPFLIAPLDDRKLLQRERRMAMAFLVVSLVLLALCAWAISGAQRLESTTSIAT